MKHFVFLFIIISLGMQACRKEKPSATVVYRVNETSSGTPAYTTAYTADNGATRTEGPITTSSWASPSFIKHNGDHVSLKVDGGTGTGTFTLFIYVNGSLVVTDHFDNPFGPKTIETDIVL